MEFVSRTVIETNPNTLVEELVKDHSQQYDLGFLFVSSLSKHSAIEVASLFKRRIKVKHLLGCTCAGIIGSDAEIEYRPAAALTLAQLPGVNIKPFALDQNQLENLNEPKDWYEFFEMYPTEKPQFLTLPDPFTFDMNQFLEKVNQAYPNCPIMGGLASGANQPRENILILNDEQMEQGIVGVMLTGNVNMDTVVSQGCRPIGETYIVTKAEGNIVYELAGRSFYKVLEEILSKAAPRDKLLAQEAIFVGIAMNEYKDQFKRGDFLIRGVMGLDPKTGSGAIADYVETGQTIQFHLRDAQTATEDLNELLSSQQRKGTPVKPKGALVFSCNGRGQNMFREKNHDITILQKHVGPVPAAGFFCAGEIGPVGGNNFLHGFTSSIALFYPKQ